MSWSPCGKYLASASFDGTVAVWDNKSGQFECGASLEGHENEVMEAMMMGNKACKLIITSKMLNAIKSFYSPVFIET